MEYGKLQRMIVEGYSSDVKHEWVRLTKRNGAVEYLTTVHYLEKYLPSKGIVADIGSGPGRYSLWLAEHGYDVVAVDPVENNIRSLKARFGTRGLSARLKGAHVGFAQNMPMLESGSFDAVISLGGPMSHIMKEEYRKKAAREFVRIAKPKARIFVSAMGKLSVLNGVVRMFNRNLDSNYIMDWARTGDYPGGWGFLPYHGFKPDELEGLFGKGTRLLAKTALEGFSAYSGDEVTRLKRNKRRWNRYLRIHFAICEEPETIGVSEHYMVIEEKR